ncbi:EAL domain-containing protein [Sulfurospirillum arcachonense]|uniref:EAL domain-containing protein n=1 Tax=Sulfurospirillum arcachonense TaxID=57666 RepID=UPI00046870B9|nr:EAL domain-containing protein [Sulfurospirillum arcachonense]
MLIKEFVQRRDDKVSINTTVQEVVEKMFQQSLKYVVVVDTEDYPIGILTERDILYLYNDNIDFNTTNAYNMSSKELIRAHFDRELTYALNFMIDHNVRRVVIIDEYDKFVGVIEQEEIIFEFEKKSIRSNFKIFEGFLSESKALSVDKKTSLKETIQLMKDKNFGSILVTDEHGSIGILTETDITQLAKDKIDKEKSVECFMHSPIYKVSMKASIHECIELMKSKKIRRIVVESILEDGSKTDYVVTSKDILSNLQGNYSKFLEEKLLSQKNTLEKLDSLVIEAYDFGNSQVVSWVNKIAKERLNIHLDDTLQKIIPKNILDESFKCFAQNKCHYEDKVEINGRLYKYSASSAGMFNSRVIKILLSDFTELYLSNRKLLDQVDIMSDSIDEQEAMQREIFNQRAIGIGYIDLNGEILFTNKYIDNLLGYDEGELSGINVRDITYEDDIEISMDTRREILENTLLPEIEYTKRYKHKNGTPIWVNSSMSVSKDKNGIPQYIIGFVKDIRGKKESESRLNLAAAVFENTNEGIVITDHRLNIQVVNNAFCEITGYTNLDVIARNAVFLQSSFHDSSFYKKMWASVKKYGYWKGEMWSTRKNGERFPQWLNISTIKDEFENIINYISVISDISTMKQSEKELEFLAHHDPLTKLPNRLLLSARLEQAIKRAKREESKIAVLFLDLDRFKEINDTYGHSYGDEILTTVTSRFKTIMREKDTIARIGGDEFIMLIEELENISDIEPVLCKVLNIFNEEINVEHISFKLTASIGVSIFPDDGNQIEDLIKNADAAMYQAKDAGRNTYRFYTEEMTQSLFANMLMKNEIDRSLKTDEFILHYQPQVSIKTLQVLGIEALVRWNHPNMGLMYPDRFIKIAENTKQIIELGKKVLEMACKDAKDLIDQELFEGRISVNVSAVQIKQDDFYDVVISILKKTGLSGNYLELELTESYIMENPKDAIHLFKKLKNHGITLSIDDFGTGYSSLSYLKKLPVDKLKIDRSFIMDIPNDKEDMAITSTIIAMSKSLGLSVIAEGIETQEQHAFLKKEGCYEGQGYLYSRPIDIISLKEFLQK